MVDMEVVAFPPAAEWEEEVAEEEWEEEEWEEEWEEEVVEEEWEEEVVVDAVVLLEEEEEEEEGSQEVSAVPTPTLHLPSLSPAGAVVKAKVRTVV